MQDDIRIESGQTAVFDVRGARGTSVKIRAFVTEEGDLDLLLVGLKADRISVIPFASNHLIVRDVV